VAPNPPNRTMQRRTFAIRTERTSCEVVTEGGVQKNGEMCTTDKVHFTRSILLR